MRAAWRPGEPGASRQMDAFVAGTMGSYSTEQDRPIIRYVAHLATFALGEISARQTGTRPAALGDGGRAYLREIGWREFSYHMLFHFPRTRGAAAPEFRDFPWRVDAAGLKAGRAGILDILWWMPACANCGIWDGCTTGADGAASFWWNI